MTQRQYLEWMASICGDPLPSSATDADLISWAKSKGMRPAVGWNLPANLTKETMAQTLVQLFDLAPGNPKADPVRILEREGIIIPPGNGLVTTRTFTRVIGRAALSSRGRGNGHGHGQGPDKDDDQGHHGDDDGDDDDGPRPTQTKPGHGHGDKNHDHTGPPGHGQGKPPKPSKSSKK